MKRHLAFFVGEKGFRAEIDCSDHHCREPDTIDGCQYFSSLPFTGGYDHTLDGSCQIFKQNLKRGCRGRPARCKECLQAEQTKDFDAIWVKDDLFRMVPSGSHTTMIGLSDRLLGGDDSKLVELIRSLPRYAKYPPSDNPSLSGDNS